MKFNRMGQTGLYVSEICMGTWGFSGRNYFGPDGSTFGSLTPAGVHPLWSKRASRHTLAPRLRAEQVQV